MTSFRLRLFVTHVALAVTALFVAAPSFAQSAAPLITGLTPSSLPDGLVNQTYGVNLTPVCGIESCPVPPIYQLLSTGGSLPPGLTLQPSDPIYYQSPLGPPFLLGYRQLRIQGTPTQTGNFSFVIYIQDVNRGQEDFQFSIQVSSRFQIVTTSPLPVIYVGIFTRQTLNATGGVTPYCWNVSGLPPGMMHSQCDGAISGTPTTPGTYRTVATVTDSNSVSPSTATKTFTWEVDVALAITTTTLPDGVEGTQYSTLLSPGGGASPYSWGVVEGALPPGLQLNPFSGLITGTPSQAGAFSFVVQLTDASQASVTKSFEISVSQAPLSIVTTSTTNGQVGIEYSQQFAASGGVGDYIWSLTAGTLPEGLTLSPAGLLAGTPTKAGKYVVTLQVASGDASVSGQFTLNVLAAPLNIVTTSLPEAKTGTSYSQALEATGGVPPYTWNVVDGQLPQGLTLDQQTGVISGAPTATGTFTFAMRVADSAGSTDTSQLTLTVSAALAPLSVQTTSLEPGLAGYFYKDAVEAAGGVPPYTWQLTGGQLPSGVKLNPDTGEIFGTPTESRTFPIQLSVTDKTGATASASLDLVIKGPLAIVTESLSPAMVGIDYTLTFEADGGKPDYSWSSTGDLPPGLQFADGVLSGTPTAAGKFGFTVSVTDQTKAVKSRYYTLNVGRLPAPSITGPPGQAPAASQQTVAVVLASAYQLPLTGTLQLTFTPDQGPDDPAVQFSTGGREVSFTIPAGSTDAVFSVPPAQFQTGTVAGVITLTATFQSGNLDVTPSPAPQQTVRVNAAAPVITSVKGTRSGTTLTLVIVGYSTPRDMTSASVTFTDASGTKGSPITVQLGSTFQQWYASDQAGPFGSQFALTLPFTVSGAQATTFTGVSVTLTNSAGTSAAANATF